MLVLFRSPPPLDCAFRSNHAFYEKAWGGAGILVADYSTLTLSGVSFHGNWANSHVGDDIYNFNGQVTFVEDGEEEGDPTLRSSVKTYGRVVTVRGNNNFHPPSSSSSSFSPSSSFYAAGNETNALIAVGGNGVPESPFPPSLPVVSPSSSLVLHDSSPPPPAPPGASGGFGGVATVVAIDPLILIPPSSWSGVAKDSFFGIAILAMPIAIGGLFLLWIFKSRGWGRRRDEYEMIGKSEPRMMTFNV